jgi:hypothetical protein
MKRSWLTFAIPHHPRVFAALSMPDELLAWCEETIKALKPKKE